jgi:excisionase family DNA binding protein
MSSMTVREAAVALGVSQAKVYRLVRSGAMRATRSDGLMMIAAAEVERVAMGAPTVEEVAVVDWSTVVARCAPCPDVQRA